MTIEAIATQIASSKVASPVTIAVQGFGGSGKTTFADKLAATLGDAYVINIDDFIIKEKLSEHSWENGAFDRTRLENEVLIPISKGESASYRKLEWVSNTLSEPVTVPPVRYLIVEGITSYHPNIAHYYNYKIWIDTTLDIAKERGHARDGSNENAANWDLWAENDLAYQEKYHPELQADFIYQNN